MIDPKTFRAMVALVHTAPGARLALRTTDGIDLTVAADDAADLGACRLRRALIAGGDAGAGFHRDVERATVTGDLQEIGPGLFRSATTEARWFTSLLAPGTVEQLLVAHAGARPSTVEVDVTIRPDGCLGATVVSVAGPVVDIVHDVAVEAAAGCAGEELLRFVSAARATGRDGGRA